MQAILPPAQPEVAETVAVAVARPAADPVAAPAPSAADLAQPTPEEQAAADVAAPGPTAPAATEPGRTAEASAATTGVQAGVTLTPMAGGSVGVSGTVIENAVITGDVTFTGSDLTLRNVRVTGEVIFRGDRLVLQDMEVGALSLSGTAGVRAARIEVFGALGKDGIHITSDSGAAADIVLEDVWVHNPMPLPTSHYDGIQVRGVTGLTLRRVDVELGAFAPQHNAALFLENANGGNSAIDVDGSRFLGGGYVMYVFASDVRIVSTVVGLGQWGHVFPRSPLAGFVSFAGNVSAQGEPLMVGAVAEGTAFLVDPAGPAALRSLTRTF